MTWLYHLCVTIAPVIDVATLVVKVCKIHGPTKFRLHRGKVERYRCVKCCSAAVDRQRWKNKRALVEESGGCCSRCGYNTSLAALEFHHVDPAEKAFALSGVNFGNSLQKLRAEAAKCILVCANCHREIEYGDVAEW